MKLRILLFAACSVMAIQKTTAQDSSTVYQLDLRIPVADYSLSNPSPLPSMQQATDWSNSLYDAAFWGISKAGNRIFSGKKGLPEKRRQFFATSFSYALQLGFARYGSELPIPLGVWAHEEYHRAVLSSGSLRSKNGNFFINRWDGTVYGIGDTALASLKNSHPEILLYSYTSGAQAELMSTRTISMDDFFNRRTQYRNALLLYNSWYVYNYFHFACSPLSDSVKVIAPAFEDQHAELRDFAGADLNAWVYDMLSPGTSFFSRDSFPNGEGVNRRIGFSDLSGEGRAFLTDQKRLSLINFINPGIFFINRIPAGRHASFTFFAQYAPVHFGNAISLTIPARINACNFYLRANRFANRNISTYGVDAGISDWKIRKTGRLSVSASASFRVQPESYFSDNKNTGGSASLSMACRLSDYFSVNATVFGKTKGWEMGSPYLNDNFSVQAGLRFHLPDQGK